MIRIMLNMLRLVKTICTPKVLWLIIFIYLYIMYPLALSLRLKYINIEGFINKTKLTLSSYTHNND